MSSKWDWQVFLQDTGGGRTYLEWMMSAWGWTMSVAILAAGSNLTAKLSRMEAHRADQRVDVPQFPKV